MDGGNPVHLGSGVPNSGVAKCPAPRSVTVSGSVTNDIWDTHLSDVGLVWWAICCHSKVGVPRCCFNGVASDGILPRHQMGVINV